MSYEKYYPNGWQSGESGGTPITPEALNHIENGIQTAYESFAPAGYGLGGSCITVDHWDNATANGFYHSAWGGPINGSDFQGIVIRYANGILIQKVWRTWADTIISAERRRDSDGTWQSWEWVNPPMELGAEYRTTRRSNGKVVYAKKVNLGKVVHQGEYDTGVSGDIVEWVATLPGVGISVPYNGISTDYYSATSVHVGLSITSGTWRTHWVIGTNYSGKYTAHVELWYTKD